MANRWTLAEKSILKTSYGKFSIEKIQLLIYSKSNNTRSFGAIKAMAHNLGVSKKVNINEWSNLEIEYLLNNYNQKTLKIIAKELNRTYFSVNSYFFKHYSHLSKNLFYNNRFTPKQKKFVRENYRKIPLKNIIKKIGISRGTILTYLKSINIDTSEKHLTVNDKEFINKYHNKYSLSDLARILKVSPSLIRLYSVPNKIKFKKSSMYWTDKDKLFVKNNYKNMYVKDIAKYLNRSASSVNSFLQRNGLKKK